MGMPLAIEVPLEVYPFENISYEDKNLLEQYPDVPIYKLGFFNDRENQPIWK